MEVENKGAKINIYQDQRDQNVNADDMSNWDQKKLEEAVDFNERKYTGGPNKTEKICDHFIKALEDKKYGWFWVCPNGHNCKYRHCLPPGFVLKSSIAKAEEKVDLNIEKDIDTMREL